MCCCCYVPSLTSTSDDLQVRFSTTNGPLTSINHDRLNMKFTIDAKFKANLRQRSRNEAKLLPVSGFAESSHVVQSPSSSPTSSTCTMGVPSTPELPSSPDVNNTSLYEMHQQQQQQQQQQHHYQQSAFDNSFSQQQPQFRQNIDFDAPVKVEPVSPPMPSIKLEFPEQVQVRIGSQLKLNEWLGHIVEGPKHSI